MKQIIAIITAVALALPVISVPAEAGWRKNYKRHSYSRPHKYRSYYYGPRYYGGPYAYGPRLTAGEAAGGLIIALVALAAANAAANQATQQPYAYVPPQPGYDVNGGKVCVGGPNFC